MDNLIIFAAMGAFVGVLAGLFGIGGGLILVPALVFILARLGLDENAMHMAIGTSLATISLTAISSAWSHHRRGAVQWFAFLRMLPGLVIGVSLGAWVADYLKSNWLSALFAAVAMLMAFYIILGTDKAKHSTPHADNAPGVLVAAGFLLGVLPGIVGVGGGMFLVPFLMWRGFAPAHAVGTSSACTLPVGVAGALGYVITGQGVAGLPDGSWGYVYLPAVVAIAVVSMLTAPLGAVIAHRLPRQQLRRAFGFLLLGIGAWMLWNTVKG